MQRIEGLERQRISIGLVRQGNGANAVANPMSYRAIGACRHDDADDFGENIRSSQQQVSKVSVKIGRSRTWME